MRLAENKNAVVFQRVEMGLLAFHGPLSREGGVVGRKRRKPSQDKANRGKAWAGLATAFYREAIGSGNPARIRREKSGDASAAWALLLM